MNTYHRIHVHHLTFTRMVIRVSLFFAMIWFAAQKVSGQDRQASPDMIVHNAKVTTLVDSLPAAGAFAIRGEKIVAVGSESEIMRLKGPHTVVIDADGRRVIPGLNDSHLHAIRGGLQYNLELRWDGVTSLAYALQMIRQQALRTPPGQWVRVIGGWSPYQFKEKRFPTISELNQASPNKPVFVLFAYSRVWLNRAAVAVLKLTPKSKPAKGGQYEFVDGGAVVRGTLAVYATIAKLPPLYAGDRINSIQHFFRELNRFGITSAIDAGATGVAYPQDYREIATLASLPKFPIRISNFLFPQKPGTELQSFKKWTSEEKPQLNHSSTRLHGYVLDGGGEIIVWGASDFENFMEPRPEMKKQTDSALRAVTMILASHQWPIRIHATYDETITRILDVFEPVFRKTNYKSRWVIDHAETISPKNIARIKAMGGGIAVQDRLAFAGEFFAERYGKKALATVQPLRAIIDSGIPVGAGTDATRVSSYNPWVSLYWMVTGKTVGGMQILSPESRISRLQALKLYTIGSAWISGEERLKGRIEPGQYADFAILSADFLTVPDEHIGTIESVLTVTGGDIVYSSAPYTSFKVPQLKPVSPAWSPVVIFGGYHK